MKFKRQVYSAKSLLPMLVGLLLLSLGAQGATINEISNHPDFSSTDLNCGVMGGCRLHIRGTGFDVNYNNQVIAGPYACEIDNYYTSSELLVCEMPRMYYGAHDNLEVVLKVRDQIVYCPNSRCKLDFEVGKTPMIYYMYPQALFAGQRVMMEGFFRTNYHSAIKEIRISGRNCERTEEQMESTIGGYGVFDCKVPDDMENGEHILSLTSDISTGFDSTLRDAIGFTVGTDTNEYNLRVHPKINSLSANSGYLNGQLLEIVGNGFGTDKSKVKVQLQDVNCNVLFLEPVDAVNEDGSSIVAQKITCSLEARAEDFTDKMFIGGAGFRNQVYEGRDWSLTSMLGEPTKTIRYDRTALVLENQLHESEYTQRMYGVFRSREAGTYKFKIAGDDQSKLLISDQPLNKGELLDQSALPEAVCKIDSHTHFREFHKFETQSCEYDLQANSDYYMMVLNNEGGGADHITLGVTIPNSDATVKNQTPQVQKVEIKNTPVRQVISLKIMNAIGGTFRLVFQERNSDTGESVYYKETADIPNDADADTVASKVRQRIGTTSTCVRVSLDENENVTNDSTKTKGFRWTLTFEAYRTRDMLPQFKIDELVGSNIKTSATEDRAQSKPVDGYFYIKYGNSDPVKIWYYYNGSNFKSRLMDIPELIGGVTVVTEGNNYDGYTWYVYMDSITGVAADLSITENLLTKEGAASPDIKINPLYKAHTIAQPFMPVPSEFLRTAETFPQVTVTVDNMLAGCDKNDCQFNYLPSTETPSVTSFTLSGTALSIQVAYPSGRILAAVDEASVDTVSVRFGNSDCSVTSVTPSDIQCTMPTNPDSSLQIETGSFVPMVHLKGRGYYKFDTSVVTPHDVTLSVSDVNPKEGSIGGGTILTISGVGFANDSPYGNSNEVTIGNDNTNERNPCKVVSFNSSEIKCETMAPGNLGSKIFITTNGQTVETTLFSFEDSATPKITSLSPNNSSPVLKNDLVINGTGFSADPSDFTVWLKPEEADGKEYECNTVSSTTTTITCRLSGGRKGAYRIKVHMKGKGFSMPQTTDVDLFHYRTTVTSITPNSGSTAGGTVLTIQGTNFSLIKNENQVVIGESGFDYCMIITATATEITCRVNAPQEVPPATPPPTVYVLGRIQERAECLGTCEFVFDEAKTPTVSSITPTSAQTGNTITVNGTGFTADAANTVVTVGGVEASNVTVVSATKITFDMPAMEWGSHEPKILVGNDGYAKFDSLIMLESALIINSMTPTSGSRYGAIFTINGNGFKTSDMTVRLRNTECDVWESTTNQITASCGYYSSSNPENLTVRYQDADNENQDLTCDGCVYTATHYPYVRQVLSSAPYALPDVVIAVDGDDLKIKPDTQGDLYQESDIRCWLKATNPEKYKKFAKEGTAQFTASGVNCTFNDMVAGEYELAMHYEGVGFARMHSDVGTFTFNPEVTTWNKIESSFVGGSELVIEGKGFPPLEHKDLATVSVCNQHCVVTESSSTTLKCQTPSLVTEDVQDSLSILEPEVQRDAVVTGDRTHSDMSFIMDGDVNTYYYGDGAPGCWVKMDFGEHSVIKATKLRLFPRVNSNEWDLAYGVLEASMDDTNWTTLVTLPETIIENWNTFKPGDNEVWKFRYLRYSGGRGGRCYVAEIETTGYRFASIPNFNTTRDKCSASLSIAGASTGDLDDKVDYGLLLTPTVTSISPELGTTIGGTDIIIRGGGFETSDTKVLIDDIECSITAITNSTIHCTTGARPEFTESKLDIISKSRGRANTNGHLFLYIDRWSSANTWGGEAPPREGDSVHVPKGQVLLVDVSPPPLYTVIVEGVIMWADEQDLTFEAWFIMVRNGQFKIGSREKPHQHNLTITMHGQRESKMLPGFGNKAIMVQDGQIDIHGKPLDVTWTELEIGAKPGDTEITLIEEVPGWKAGDKIIIAPTGQSRDEVEERTIQSIAGKVITLDTALEFHHFAGVVDPNVNHLGAGETERLNTIDPPNRDSAITIRAEVGLLTRNVKIQGDEETMETGHGVHILVRGAEGVARGRYSYMEVFRAGQKFQLGRYPIHYHMIGHVVDNYVIGCAVHQTFNRGTTIHGVHYLTLQHNVYYRTMGHTIFLEDGIETNNLIEHNLVVHVRKSTSMLMSDLKPSGLWQARPTNFIRDNHFVACEGNGTWFELVVHPTGPSATSSICSVSDPLTQYDRNVHHTNEIGLRIYPHYFPETHPCQANSNHMLRDPWAENPGAPARLKDNIMYMNYSLGSFGKKLGAVQYVRTTFISNATNQLIFRADLAKDQMCRLEDSIHIGNSELVSYHTDAEGNPKFGNSTGINLPQTSGLLVTNTRFYNFNNGVVFNACASCGNEKKRQPGGEQVSWEKVQFKNISVTLFNFRMFDYDKDIEKDIDGSLIKAMLEGVDPSKHSQFDDGGWMTPWFPHLNIPECVKQENPLVCSAPCAICDNSIRLRRVKTTPLDDLLLLNGQDMKLFTLGKYNDNSNPYGFNVNMNGGLETKGDQNQEPGRLLDEIKIKNPDDDKFTFNKFRNCLLSIGWRGWMSVVPTSYQFNFHFGNGVEWKKVRHENDYYWGLYGPEQPMYFRSNHTEPRESFTGLFYGVGINDEDHYGVIEHDGIIQQTLTDDNKFGDFAYNVDEKMITWKLDEKRIGAVENTVVYCTGSNCITDTVPDSKISDVVTYWSDATQWPNEKLPTGADTEVVIEETWNMHYDMDEAAYTAAGITDHNYIHLKIKGRLTMDPTKDLTLNAYLIEIFHGGELIIGSADTPNDKKVVINLLGDKASEYINVTADIAPVNKTILNKGLMHMYGVTPEVTWTHLTAKVSANDAHFFVEGANLGWNVGDELVVSSSSQTPDEYEKVTIKALIPNASAGTTEVQINETMEHMHYGSPSTTTTPKGQIDLRAEVGNLTRNVKIVSDLTDTWGCTILTPSWTPLEKDAQPLQGNLKLEGIEIQNCGQRDTRKAAVDLNWVKKIRGTHSVNKCSFNNGQGWALNMEKAEGLSFTNNVIYNARRFGIYLGKNIKGVQINDNLIVGIKERPNYDNVEYFDTLVGIYHDDPEGNWHNPENPDDDIVMKRNSVSGCPWFGYALPGVDCTERAKDQLNFVDNVAHSNRAGWIPLRITGQSCALFSHFHAYKNWEQGVVHRADAQHVEVNNMILTDNRNQIAINAGNGALYPSIKFSDSAVIGKSMIDCPECYTGDDCETTGMMSGMFNKSPYEFYWEDTRLPMHNSTNVQFTFGGIQDVTNVDFLNFEENDNCPNVKQTAIRMNNFYQDNGITLTFKDITLTNVDDKNKLFFPNHKRHPDPGAYCNKVDCTANYNNLFVDVDGAIMGTGSTMHYFGNNKSAGRDGDCTFFEDWNGHACNPVYAQLLLTRQPDERGLNIFPLILKIEEYEEDKSDDLKFLVESNGPREVYSLIKKNVETFVQTSQTMPSGLTYQLESSSDSDYVIIKVYSENPATMNVKTRNPKVDKRNRRKKPKVLKVGETIDFHSEKDNCGFNHYEPKTRILRFVVPANDCEVTVEFANALQLSTHLNIEPDKFFESDLLTTFLDRMAALLEISIDRIKVVDVRKGSTIVVTEIMTDQDVTAEREDKQAVIDEFESFKTKFEKAVANEEIDLGAPVLDIQTEMAIDDVEPVAEDTSNTGTTDDTKPPVEEEEEGSNPTRNILLGIFIPLIVIGIGVGVFFLVKHLKGKNAGSNKETTQSSRGNITKDLTSNRDHEVQNFVVNNNGPRKFGASGNIKFTKQISLNQNPNLESYIKRKS